MSPLFGEPFLQATGRCNSVVVQSFSHLGGITNNNFLGCTNSQIVLNSGSNEKWINKTDQVLDFSHLSLSWNWGASIERSCLRVFGRRGNGCDGTSTDDSHAAVLVRRVPAILHQYTYLEFHNQPITYNSSQMFHALFIARVPCVSTSHLRCGWLASGFWYPEGREWLAEEWDTLRFLGTSKYQLPGDDWIFSN